MIKICFDIVYFLYQIAIFGVYSIKEEKDLLFENFADCNIHILFNQLILDLVTELVIFAISTQIEDLIISCHLNHSYTRVNDTVIL